MKMKPWAYLGVLILLVSCASAGKMARIPSKMLPHNGMTSARAAGFGQAGQFLK